MPESMPSREAIELALEDILAWPELARSPQLSKFLRYIVDAKLAGDEAGIKAYSIAVDVFGRPQTFDPQSDPIVRVQARRLRSLLDEYYRGPGAASPVRFYLPVGRYIPEILTQGVAEASTPAPEAEPEPALPTAVVVRRTTRVGEAVLVGILAVVAIGFALLIGSVLQPRQARALAPDVPTVSVAEFTAVAGSEAALANVAGLAVELVTDLALFEDIHSIYLGDGTTRTPDGEAGGFVLAGIARAEGKSVQITASLRRAGTDVALWSDTVTVPVDALQASVDDISQAFAEELGSHRGPLHADAMRWLNDNASIEGSESDYICGLLFSRYRDSGAMTDAERARSCASSLLRREPESAPGLAISGALLLDNTVMTLPPGRFDPEPLTEAERLLDEARGLAPTDSLVWEQYARFLEGTRRSGEADAAYASALQLNPANLDAQAAYARMLSLRGKSERGAALAQSVLDRAVEAPHWYYAAPAVNALRDGDYAMALAYSEKLAVGDAELGSAIATAAAHRLGNEGVLNRYFAQLLDVTRFRRFGILPVLRQRVSDTDLVTEIGNELLAAGVAGAALNERF